jgi:hypothetical protein
VSPAARLPNVIDQLQTEKGWSASLIEGFHFFRYLTNHVYPLATKTGFRTSTTLKGWPDLTAIGTGQRAGWLIFIEVKGPKTAVAAEQIDVLEWLSASPQALCWLLRPQDDEGRAAVTRWMARPWEAPRTFGWDRATLRPTAELAR